MKFQLRDYQQDAVDAVLSWVKQSTSSCVIDLPTGAGKSLVVAEIARNIHLASKKKVLCLAPSKELVQQNAEKYRLTGNSCSIFSASAGSKDTTHFVVFGSPLTVKNSIDKFGSQYAAVVIDEAHGINPTLIDIITSMQSANPYLRVIGMTATPYKLGMGYIYKNHYKNGGTPEDKAKDPFFDQLVYEVPGGANYLIEHGYLTPPVTQSVSLHYDTSSLEIGSNGMFTNASLDKAFTGQGRKTSMIVADVVSKSAMRRGVMIFASTIKHANEIMESLPPELSELVTGKDKKKDRELKIKKFKEQKIKYMVNVSTLTTGFDAPHVDVIAVLRATESPGLYQQIMGRGLRLCDGKVDCLLLDYADNIETFFPDGDLFNPDIKASRTKESARMKCYCPQCGGENNFAARENPEQLEIDSEGYFIDGAGDRIMTQQFYDDGKGNAGYEEKPMPAHYGRRCQAWSLDRTTHQMVQCTYKWDFKECPECGHENDIASRYCSSCKCEIVDPNEKLQEVATWLDNDPYAPKVADVIDMRLIRHMGASGKPDSVRVEYKLQEAPYEISEWLCPLHNNEWLLNQYRSFVRKACGGNVDMDSLLSGNVEVKPVASIAYRKKKNSKYYDVVTREWR